MRTRWYRDERDGGRDELDWAECDDEQQYRHLRRTDNRPRRDFDYCRERLDSRLNRYDRHDRLDELYGLGWWRNDRHDRFDDGVR